MSITRIGEMQAKPELTDALRDFLFSVFPMIESARGFESVQLLQSHTEPSKFLIIEMWDSIESHQAAAKIIPPGKLEEIRAMLASTPSGGYFNLVENR